VRAQEIILPDVMHDGPDPLVLCQVRSPGRLIVEVARPAARSDRTDVTSGRLEPPRRHIGAAAAITSRLPDTGTQRRK
jgi:hypothetical protein